MSRMLREQDVAFVDSARQGAMGTPRGPLAAARCRVGDEHRLPDQKRHVCESEIPKFGGVGAMPMLCLPLPPQVRVAVAGSYEPWTEKRSVIRYSTLAPAPASQ